MLPFRVLAWVASALSIANLVRDLDWISLKGIVAEWVTTYERLVSSVSEFLFGWIHVSWMDVSEAESHLLVVLVLVGSSMIKGYAARDPDGPPMVITGLFGALFYLLLGSIAMLLLPGGWGFWVPAALAGITFLTAVFNDEDDYDRRAARLNLVAVVGCTIIVVLVGSFWE